jgi:ubiquinone/menaquinone biosynthesis C-methylase UbiE
MEIKINTNIQEAYSNQYNDESSIWRAIGAKKKVENILKITVNKTFNRVLEVGAGDGSVLKLLSENNFAKEYYALEISDSGLEQLKGKKIQNLISAQLFDGYKLPFDDKSFDLVILTHVLEHVEHERILLKEIHRVASNLLIEVPKDYRFNADKKIKHFLSYGHINLYTPTSLKFLLLTENFKIIDEKVDLYEKESYLFNQKGIVNQLKANISYLIKFLLVKIPIRYINNKFINTITILAESETKEIKIF